MSNSQENIGLHLNDLVIIFLNVIATITVVKLEHALAIVSICITILFTVFRFWMEWRKFKKENP